MGEVNQPTAQQPQVIQVHLSQQQQQQQSQPQQQQQQQDVAQAQVRICWFIICDAEMGIIHIMKKKRFSWKIFLSGFDDALSISHINKRLMKDILFK